MNDEILVQIEGSPINPSDLGLLLGAAELLLLLDDMHRKTLIGQRQGRGHAGNTAACLQGGVYAPEFAEGVGIEAGHGMAGAMTEKLSRINADAAGTDDGNALADDFLAAQDIQVADHAGVIDAGDIERARHDAGGEHEYEKNQGKVHLSPTRSTARKAPSAGDRPR